MSLAKSLEDEELQIKNEDKTTANYAKRFIKKKENLPTRFEDSEDFTTNSISKCKFCDKEQKPNKCRHLQAECQYYHKIGYTAKFFLKKKSFPVGSRRVVTYTYDVLCFFTPSQPKILTCTINNKFLKSFVEKIIINYRAEDNFFSNRTYFCIYKEYHHKFQNSSGEVFATHGYEDLVLPLAYFDKSEVIRTIKKVSGALSLEHNLLSKIPLAQKGVEVYLEISHQGNIF